MKVVNYLSFDKGSAIARFDIEMANGMILRDFKLMKGQNGDWLSYPSKEYMKDNEKKFMSYIFFKDMDIKKKFDQAVLDLIPKPESSHDDAIPF